MPCSGQKPVVTATGQAPGLVNATDLDGGFLAWAAAGLPCEPGQPQA